MGGIKYSVADRQSGFLVEPKDPDAAGRRLCDVLSDGELRATLAREALRRVKRLFTWRKVTAAIAEVYEDVLTQPPPRAIPARARAEQARPDAIDDREPATQFDR